MALPRPQAGLVIHYAYLWRFEHRRGRTEGVKHRPCAIVLAVERATKGIIVTAVPVTHRPPSNVDAAVLLPQTVKRHLGLDADASWIIADEVNQFIWPGPDIQPIPSRRTIRFDYGFLPEDLFNELRRKVIAQYRAGRLKATRRSE